jgi:hypothetical protein
MSWERAREKLLKVIVPLMEDKDKGTQWVELLGRSKDGMRLGACIVIDFRYGAIEPKVFADILEHLDFSKEDAQKNACWAFHDAIMNHPANRHSEDKSCFSCSSGFAADGKAPEAYARVLNISDFIGRVVSTKEKPMSALNRDDKARVKRMYFEREDQPWEDLERNWSGKMGRVFVTSWHDLSRLLASKDGKADPGRVVNDALGLGLPVTVEFIAVKYPGALDARFHQPSVLDVDWANVNWYVSQRNVNGWGRAQRCSGSGPAAPERVHRKLESISGGFSGKYIGTPRKALEENRDKLLKEAFARM